MVTFGLDPITASLLTSLGTDLIGSIFRPPAPAGPSAAEIAAILKQQRAASSSSSQNAWLLGLGLVAVGAIGFVMLRSRK